MGALFTLAAVAKVGSDGEILFLSVSRKRQKAVAEG
jgi:hypothetical protein